MKTEELIRALAADGGHRVEPIARTLLRALVAGCVLSAALFVVMLHPRQDIAFALFTPRFILKVVVVLSVAVTAGIILARAARPLPAPQRPWILAIPILLLGAGVAIELLTMPPATWSARLIGHNASHCLSLIPLLSIAPAVCLLLALRRGAPLRPTFAGAAAGLVAGGCGSALYALTCQDDSPLFVAAWYSIAIAAVAVACAYAGRRTLRW